MERFSSPSFSADPKSIKLYSAKVNSQLDKPVPPHYVILKVGQMP